jgi:hypothetical protein
MVQALAPRLSLWYLAVVLLALTPSLVLAQEPGKAQDAAKDADKAAAKKADDPAKKADDDDKQEGVIDAAKEGKRGAAEIFKDPRAEKALENKYKPIPAPAGRLNNVDRSTVKGMAGMQVNPDPVLITKVVDFMIADLTDRKSIQALLDPKAFKANADANRAIEGASQTLVDLLNTARANKNEQFLSIYRKILLTKLTPLLQNQLFPRIQASIILAMAATPEFLDVFIKQLKDADQVFWVKLWAARGITNATDGGKVTVDVVKATESVKALVDFLENESDAPWWIKLRAFEALGCLRLASTTGPNGVPNVATLLLSNASDPKAKLESRAWAIWAFGMLKIPAGTAKFSFNLASYQLGLLAADLGDKIIAEYDQHKADFAKKGDRARYLTALLLYQVYPALAGDEEVPGSGILKSSHPAAVAAKPFLTGLEAQIKDVAKAALEFINSGGAQQKKARDELGKQVGELRSFLDKNKPADTELFPGAPKIAPKPAQVAGAPVAK